MNINLSDLGTEQRIIAGGGVGLLVASVLPWYGVAGFGVSGWGSGGLAVLGILAGLAAAVVGVLPSLGVEVPSVGSLAVPQLATVLAGASAALLVLRFLTALTFTQFGLYLGLAASIVIAVGAFRAMRAEGLDLPGRGSSETDDEPQA